MHLRAPSYTSGPGMSGLWSFRTKAQPHDSIAGLVGVTNAYYSSSELGLDGGGKDWDEGAVAFPEPDGAGVWFDKLRSEHEGTRSADILSELGALREGENSFAVWAMQEKISHQQAPRVLDVLPTRQLEGNCSHSPKEDPSSVLNDRLWAKGSCPPPLRQLNPNQIQRERRESVLAKSSLVGEVTSQVASLTAVATGTSRSERGTSQSISCTTRPLHPPSSSARSTSKCCGNSVGTVDRIANKKISTSPPIALTRHVIPTQATRSNSSRGVPKASGVTVRGVHHASMAARRLAVASTVTPPCLLTSKAHDGLKAALVARRDYTEACVKMADAAFRRTLMQRALKTWRGAHATFMQRMCRLQFIKVAGIFHTWMRHVAKRRAMVVAVAQCQQKAIVSIGQRALFKWMYWAHMRLKLSRVAHTHRMRCLFRTMLRRSLTRREVRQIVMVEADGRLGALADHHYNSRLKRSAFARVATAADESRRRRYRNMLVAKAMMALEE